MNGKEITNIKIKETVTISFSLPNFGGKIAHRDQRKVYEGGIT